MYFIFKWIWNKSDKETFEDCIGDYIIILVVFVVLYSMSLSVQLFRYEFKRLNMKNYKHFLHILDYEIPKNYLGVVGVKKIYKRNNRKYAVVRGQADNYTYHNVILPNGTDTDVPLALFERCSVMWVEKPDKEALYIEKIIEAMLSKDAEHIYVVDRTEPNLFSADRENKEYYAESDRFAIVPRVDKLETRRWALGMYGDKTAQYAEAWCRKNQIK
ncbi:hypothetical protein C3B58_22750, partial [Lactonifactor longoviformis]